MLVRRSQKRPLTFETFAVSLVGNRRRVTAPRDAEGALDSRLQCRHVRAGQDNIHGNAGNDQIGGEDGDDVLAGTTATTSSRVARGKTGFTAGNGDDTLTGDAGDDRAHGRRRQ